VRTELELVTYPSCDENTSSYIDDIQGMLQHVDVKIVRLQDMDSRIRESAREVT